MSSSFPGEICASDWDSTEIAAVLFSSPCLLK